MKYIAGLIFAFGALIAGAMSLFHANSIPDRVPMHWDAAGQIDRYGSRTEALWFIPIFMLFFAVIFGLIGVVSGTRLKANATKGINVVAVATVVFFLIIHNLLLSNNHDAVPQMIPYLFSGLLLVMGIAIKGVEPNPFIGIRVPWTMNSPMTWRITHERASKLWIWTGAISLMLCFAGVSMMIPILIFVVAIMYPLFDSYRISKTGSAV